jgi:hypothetical protein
VFDLVEWIVVKKCVFRARCILVRSAEEHLHRPRTRYKIEHPAGQIFAQRALRFQVGRDIPPGRWAAPQKKPARRR